MSEATFTVTRQHRWPDGEKIVEITQGGIDYSGSDALCKRYAGEMEEYQGLTPATEAAIAIAKAWQADAPNDDIQIAVGNTHGMGLHLSEEPATEEVFARMLAEAKQFDETLPRCVQCGDLLGKEKWHPLDMDADDYPCCSEHCADNLYRETERENLKFQIQEMSREDVIALLESVDIQCYDHESDEVLKEALKVNVLDGTIERSAL